MPVDRPAILRNAEKLLRSGKLDQAIAEYPRIVEDQPADWNTANALGDLYGRAAQTDRATSLAGRIHRDRGELEDAVEWLERAALAPAPTPDEGHRLLFDLAEALEHVGETARALAICMEPQADAGNYRDAAARIDRLAKVRARG